MVSAASSQRDGAAGGALAVFMVRYCPGGRPAPIVAGAGREATPGRRQLGGWSPTPLARFQPGPVATPGGLGEDRGCPLWWTIEYLANSPAHPRRSADAAELAVQLVAREQQRRRPPVRAV